jgi:hypothetical protein
MELKRGHTPLTIIAMNFEKMIFENKWTMLEYGQIFAGFVE